jgi:hypothetical protein
VNPTAVYDRAHDDAQRLARRHERDLHWAKERRRQQEREIAAATALLASSPLALARRTLLVCGVLLTAIALGSVAALEAGLRPEWLLLAGAVAVASGMTVLICAAASLAGIRERRAAARAVLRSRDARLSHTQYRIRESVHAFLESRADVVETRPADVA